MMAIPASLSRVDRVTLTLPWPPSSNNLYATVRGRRVLSRAGREYGRLVETEVRCVLRLLGATPRPPFRLTLELHPPSRRRFDLDGKLKVTQDAIFRGLGQDDSTVNELHVYRRSVDRLNPRCEVTVESLERALLEMFLQERS